MYISPRNYTDKNIAHKLHVVQFFNHRPLLTAHPANEKYAGKKLSLGLSPNIRNST